MSNQPHPTASSAFYGTATSSSDAIRKTSTGLKNASASPQPSSLDAANVPGSQPERSSRQERAKEVFRQAAQKAKGFFKRDKNQQEEMRQQPQEQAQMQPRVMVGPALIQPSAEFEAEYRRMTERELPTGRTIYAAQIMPFQALSADTASAPASAPTPGPSNSQNDNSASRSIPNFSYHRNSIQQRAPVMKTKQPKELEEMSRISEMDESAEESGVWEEQELANQLSPPPRSHQTSPTSSPEPTPAAGPATPPHPLAPSRLPPTIPYSVQPNLPSRNSARTTHIPLSPFPPRPLPPRSPSPTGE
ncbi:hypothetical protein DL546_004563 [Coniochaeta pulveracea]|uniref:Uncharacterized protein n=1 Tax=Coniochaeta pulveracea TaxID=177199 RepID=A0A420Y3F1_9PEZI|nr:hypothetical protein DL546_004563 [Coniochaeta pulveracea]